MEREKHARIGDSDPKYSEKSPAEHVRTLSFGKKPPHDMPIGSHKSLAAGKGETLNIP